jgi:predicted lipoprotein with Yx(FWY)xxD motif
MRRSRIIIAGLALAAVAAGGGITAAAATGAPASSPPAATSAPPAGPAPAAHSGAAATVRTALATVGGRTDTILVNTQGLPLYYYRPDTATRSLVTGGLATLWPPLTSAAPTATGVSGKLSVVRDVHGSQVAYNGHLLYTFTSDRAGQVTGQGFQNFFVATPALTPLSKSPAPANAAPPAPPAGYGY